MSQLLDKPQYDPQHSVQYEWVIGNFSGERGKAVEALASSGAGYILVETSGKGTGRQVIVAFRRECDALLPEYLNKVVDPLKIEKYETIRKARMRV